MSIFETKAVRLHLQDRGQYCYLLLTRFDGEDHLLGEDGWRGTYIRYDIVSRDATTEDGVTGSAFSFIRENEWLQDTIAEEFVKDLEMERIDWADIEDEAHYTEADVLQLAGREEPPAAGGEV